MYTENRARNASIVMRMCSLHQNAKRYEARNTEREARNLHISERVVVIVRHNSTNYIRKFFTNSDLERILSFYFK